MNYHLALGCLSTPFIIRVPFFLIFSVNKETPHPKKGKRVLPKNLEQLHNSPQALRHARGRRPIAQDATRT